MLEEIKKRCGIVPEIKVYDDDILSYIEDCKEDLLDSGVHKSLIEAENPGIITAVTLYVKAYLGNDRADTEKYLKLYREKAFRLALKDPVELEGGKDVERLD